MLPIGLMTEEAQEACNKLIKNLRQDFTRKISRTATMTDLMNRLLLSSDPYISSDRKLPAKRKSELSDDAIELLVAEQLPDDEDEIVSEQCNVFDLVDSD